MKALTMLLYVSHALSTTLLWRSTEQPIEIMGVSFSLLALLKMSSKFVVQWKMSHSSRVNDNGLLQVDICLIFVCASDWNIKTNTTSFVWLLSIKGYIEWTVRGSVKDRLISCEYLSEGWGVGGGVGGWGRSLPTERVLIFTGISNETTNELCRNVTIIYR